MPAVTNRIGQKWYVKVPGVRQVQEAKILQETEKTVELLVLEGNIPHRDRYQRYVTEEVKFVEQVVENHR